MRNCKLYSEVVGDIRRGRTFLVTTHERPDGDALGSALALALALRRLRKSVTVFNRDPVPKTLRFLPGASEVCDRLPAGGRFDAAFIVDCADFDRVSGDFASYPGIAKRIVIDHHALSGRAGDLNLVEEGAAASGVVVYKLLRKLKVAVSKEIATNLFCALVTDTGSFRYSNTDAEVLQLAHDLVGLGARPWEISKNLFDNFPVERLRLLHQVLGTLEFFFEGAVAAICIRQEMLQACGATADRVSADFADEFINFPRSIDSVEVAVQFRETDEGWKVSFRSKDRVDVARLAAGFGGGGHARAAGCTINAPFGEVKKGVLEALAAAI